MKKLTKSLFVLILMLGTMLEMKAADVYLLTAQTINGTVGNGSPDKPGGLSI